MSPAEFAAIALRADVQFVDSIERLKQGLTNESWRVRLAGEEVVVRIGTAADQSLQIDRRSEAAILQTVAAAGIGPPVLLCDPQHRVLVTRYLGPTWSESDVQDAANIARLGTTLRHLHSLRPPAGVQRVVLRKVIDDYLQTLTTHGRPQDATRIERACSAAALLDDGARTCLCHNDVHRLNIIDDGRVRFIDWEYAGVGSPLFDLASVCVYHCYDGTQRAQLLIAYACPDVATAELLEQACEVFDYVRELWMQVRGLEQSAEEASREW